MSNEYPGPTLDLSIELDKMKYREEGEEFHDKVVRLSNSMSDDEPHSEALMDILGNMRFLPAGRVQSSMGSRRITTSFNCFVSGEIEDNMHSIMKKAAEAAETMRRGGGIGYDFSKLRPKGYKIKSLDSEASGPVSFMGIYDAICKTISSSGHRRGAQMAVLRVDHPDIEDFITCKHNSDKLTGFNISVAVTDEFMEALGKDDDTFPFMFDGQPAGVGRARHIWDLLMKSTWDWAEPGVLFIDRINEMNNLYYCEDITATNPCGEQPLPPYGACLLGSFNLTQYLYKVNGGDAFYAFNFVQFKKDIPDIVRAMDNVIDRTIYPLKEQADEARDKRRMGLGITGLASAGEMLGLPYGTDGFLHWAEKVFTCLRDASYRASARLAKDKGCFPLFRPEYLKGNFIRSLPGSVKKEIRAHGIRNSHLTSFAPTGTISLVADNISGGIEPVFAHSYERAVASSDGTRTETIKDYAYARGFLGRTTAQLTVDDHLGVLGLAQHYVDSACSKTCNVGDDVSYNDFKKVYEEAWSQGCKGVTTFRAAGMRYGVLNEVEDAEEGACFIDPDTGARSCS